MTFSIIVPNASQSPGLFPSQNNTNFQRIKDIVNAEHNFADSSSLSQGMHKQCTMINRAVPVGLTAGNGILYSNNDTGASELYWFNGSKNVQITPATGQLASGTIAIDNVSNADIFEVPQSSFGYLYLWIDNVNTIALSFWSSSATNVTLTRASMIDGQSSTSIQPVRFANSVISSTRHILAIATNASFNATYNYRVFRVY